MADKWQVTFHCERLQPGVLANQPGGVEAAARRARYAFLARTAINVTPVGKVPTVAVAHHADDQAETLLLHLLRGSGLRGLAGMRPVAPLPESGAKVQLVRPLLSVRRQAILAYAATHGLSWREDETNHQTHFMRSRLRHEVLPLLTTYNPNLVATLSRTAALLAADSARLDAIDASLLGELQLDDGFSAERIVLDLERLLQLGVGSQRGILRRALVALTTETGEVGFDHIDSLLEQLEHHPQASGSHPITAGLAWTVAGAAPKSPARLSLHWAQALPFAPAQPFLDHTWRTQVGAVPLPTTGCVVLPGGWQLVIRRLSPADLPDQWQTTHQPWTLFCDAAQLGEAALTTPQAGQRIAPLGMGGRRKTVGDLFTDHKTPLALRAGWPVIVDRANDQVLWVCGLALAEAVRIGEATSEVVVFEWQERRGARCAAM
jgi:tRNA(Ile)-lysidine synthase